MWCRRSVRQLISFEACWLSFAAEAGSLPYGFISGLNVLVGGEISAAIYLNLAARSESQLRFLGSSRAPGRAKSGRIWVAGPNFVV